MALQASGTITAAQIGLQVNIASGQPISMQDAAIRGMSGTSAGTQVSFSTFYSQGVTSGLITGTTTGTNPTLNITHLGTISFSGTGIDNYDWFENSGAWVPGNSGWEVFVELASGSTPSGTLGSWLALTLIREYTLSSGTCLLNVYFRCAQVASAQQLALTMTEP